ncbi:MAG: cupin domain-containing protein [Proteobacteria bacterium]|nr:cupin domain-containing protein [Pseudomonadota bacterium]
MSISKALLGAGLALGLQASGAWSAESVAPKFSQVLPNVPGKSLIAVEVSFPPGTVAAPHHHPKSAALYVYVLSGTIRSQVEGEPAHTFHVGESWFEAPGAHHILAENPSKTQAAKILAVFVVDSDEKALVTPDAPTAGK